MYNLNQLLKTPTRHNILVFNGILWFVMFWVLLLIFSKTTKPIKIDYIYTIGFLSTLIPPVLINFYVLIPRLLKKQHYAVYLIMFVLNIFVWERLHSFYFKEVLDAFFKDYFFVSYHSNTSITIIFIIVLIATTFVKLTEDWIYYNANENKLLRNNNQIIESQLLALRSQINPHFLFNSLNVIYSLAIEGKKEIKPAILQLSDILRYVIYDADTKMVPIKKEVELISNFIDFQSYRVQYSKQIKFIKNIENENFGIYPMLLLPILENAFKHGSLNEKDHILVEMKQTNKGFQFKVTNSKTSISKNTDRDEYSGFGLESIKKNLEIVYPNQHELEILDAQNKFRVTLKLFGL